MTKELTLTKGFVALVDDEDHPYLSQWKWTYSGGYALRKGDALRRNAIVFRLIIYQLVRGASGHN